jgi:hypothetical protein
MSAAKHARGTYSVERAHEESTGWKGISIKAADGTYIANMVMQLDDSELANARMIVAALNRAGGRS